ncbi:hypothetical protein KEM55_004707, partial [Ascosphaera atra]
MPTHATAGGVDVDVDVFGSLTGHHPSSVSASATPHDHGFSPNFDSNNNNNSSVAPASTLQNSTSTSSAAADFDPSPGDLHLFPSLTNTTTRTSSNGASPQPYHPQNHHHNHHHHQQASPHGFLNDYVDFNFDSSYDQSFSGSLINPMKSTYFDPSFLPPNLDDFLLPGFDLGENEALAAAFLTQVPAPPAQPAQPVTQPVTAPAPVQPAESLASLTERQS